MVPPSQIRELTATCAAMCASRSLRDVLQYVVPVTQSYINTHENRRPDSKVWKTTELLLMSIKCNRKGIHFFLLIEQILKDVPSKSATVPRSSHAQKPPPIPPRANNKDTAKVSYVFITLKYLWFRKQVLVCMTV